MDIYPDSSDVTIPSGFVSYGSRGWYTAPQTPPPIVNLDKLRAVQGAAGLMGEPPDRPPLLLDGEPPSADETDMWRSILRASLHGAT